MAAGDERAAASTRRARASASPSRRSTPSANTTSSILSAKESDGLETWLTENGYRIPAGARAVLGSYIRQNMRFFVAKVNSKEQTRLGFTYLRPLQVAYESPKFMLPIRLGTVNANGPQELFIYALTRTGRVETTNYRTVRLPTGMDAAALRQGRLRAISTGRCSIEQVKKRGDARGVPRIRLGHGLVRSLRRRPAVAATSCASSASSGSTIRRRARRPIVGRVPRCRRRRTFSSRACTCAMTAHISPRTWCSRRPATARISRAATSCATHGPVRHLLRRRRVPPRAADAPRRAGAHAILADGMEDRRDPEAGGRAAGGGCCVVEGDLALNGGRKRRTKDEGRRTRDKEGTGPKAKNCVSR